VSQIFFISTPCVPRTHPTKKLAVCSCQFTVPGVGAERRRMGLHIEHGDQETPVRSPNGTLRATSYEPPALPINYQPLTINSLRATSYELRATNYNALLRVPVPRRLCVKKPVRSPNAPYQPQLFLLTIASASRFGTSYELRTTSYREASCFRTSYDLTLRAVYDRCALSCRARSMKRAADQPKVPAAVGEASPLSGS
jgi:hypothetical protein